MLLQNKQKYDIIKNMNVLEYFEDLYKDKSQVALLTWAYSIAAIVFVIIAGLFALIDQAFGVSILIIPLVSAVALCANVVVWALIRFAIESALSRRARQAQKPARGATKKTASSASRASKNNRRTKK